MSDHTEGPVIYAGNSLLNKNHDLIAVTMVFGFGEAAADANARRLAACWNALEGIPTEAIELLPTESLETARKFILRVAQSKGSPS